MRLTFILSFLLLGMFSHAQQTHNFWQLQDEQAIVLPDQSERTVVAEKYSSLELDFSALQAALQHAPTEAAYRAAGHSGTLITLPLPDGRFETFEVYNSPVFMEGLAERYPQIQSFGARGLNDRSLRARLSFSPEGFQAAIHGPQGKVHIDPFASQQSRYYVSYFTRDVVFDQQFSCGVKDHEHSDQPLESIDMKSQRAPTAGGGGAVPVELLIYRLAVSCTGEYGTQFGNSNVATVLSNFNTAINRLNLIYEQEVAIRFMIVSNTDEVIYLDGNSDPFSNPSDGGGLLAQNQSVLNMVIGAENYDVGHIFTISCTGSLAGIASRSSACTEFKARGVTCFSNTNINAVVDEIMAHEIGHQFSASHSWNNCPAFIDQLSASTAYEPGSGSTIMSYSGSCGNQNVQFSSDNYFHVGSLEQIYEFSRQGNGSTCGTLETTSNNLPELSLAYEDNFFLPISTPFRLKADASDADGDAITYCWEQFNTGPVVDIGNPIGNAPLFRSFPPTTSPVRTFPRIGNIVNGVSDVAEVLPFYTRDMDFRCTVRDNNPEAGGVVWEHVSFRSSDAAGPFIVTGPNTNVMWEAGSVQQVTWNVANTDQSPVNCQRVNINLSVSGGFSFPIALAENVPNDGSHFIVVPNNLTSDARIEVQAADNIFFNMSKPDFEIIDPATPGVYFNAGPYEQQVCLPSEATIDVQLDDLVGYDSLVSLSVSGLPNGAMPVYSANPVQPSAGSAPISIDMTNVTQSGVFEVDITLSGPNITDITRSVFLNVISNDFSSFAPTLPANGATGVSEVPSFSWTDLPNVGSVIIEIATNPGFGNSIVETATVTGASSFTLNGLLNKNTPYFWRIKPVNDCGEGEFSTVWAFQTETLSCAAVAYQGGNVNISSQGMPVVESVINVPSGGEISDLNITNVKGQHDLVKHLELSLVSPGGTEVVLFTDLCGNTQLFDIGLDDEAPNDIPCPPIGGGDYKPQGSLTDFNGESSQGDWTLKVAVIDDAGQGGTFQNWGLEICSNASLNGPFIVNNNTLAVKPNEGNPITADLLMADDADNEASELTFTIVEAPLHGTLYKVNTPLGVGSKFTQLTIDAGNLRYVNDINASETADNFTFAVDDGEGGWVGGQVFSIDIDENATTGIKDLFTDNELLLLLYPNPARDELRLQLRTALAERARVRVLNVQGQLIQETYLAARLQQSILHTAALSSGLYFLQIETSEGNLVNKFTIQR